VWFKDLWAYVIFVCACLYLANGFFKWWFGRKQKRIDGGKIK